MWGKRDQITDFQLYTVLNFMISANSYHPVLKRFKYHIKIITLITS